MPKKRSKKVGRKKSKRFISAAEHFRKNLVASEMANNQYAMASYRITRYDRS